MTSDQIAKAMLAQGILALSIRPPTAENGGRWKVSSRTAENQLKWDEGRPMKTLNEALSSRLGSPASDDLSELLG